MDPRLLHQPARQRRGQRWQGHRGVAQHLHHLAARAEQQHRSELAVGTAAQDQLVAFIAIHHRLHGHALKVMGTGALGDG